VDLGRLCKSLPLLRYRAPTDVRLQALHFMKTIKEVKWEHYDHRYNGNMWSFLGNGRVKAEMFKDVEKLAPYMRNSDVRSSLIIRWRHLLILIFITLGTMEYRINWASSAVYM